MKRDAIKWIQNQLNTMGHDAGTEDGIAGGKTFAALIRASRTPNGWSKERQLVGFVQAMATAEGLEAGPVDGYWGPQTEYAFDELVARSADVAVSHASFLRPEELPQINPHEWPKESPQGRLVSFYGNPGENQSTLTLPYPHILSWKRSSTITRFSCHEKVHDSMERVLHRVLDHYGMDEIKRLRLNLWGGCLNVRKKRGGSSFSTHSWGIAVDYDPSRNKLVWGRDKAAFSRSEYDMWWQLWEEEGWVSLGRSRNFDWMHVQACTP